MKKYCYKNFRLNLLILVVSTFFIYSCGQKSIPPEFVGQWKTDKHIITVRTKPEKGNWQFTSDSAIIVLRINNDKTAAGSIGSAAFENAKIRKNQGNPDRTGVAYIIECGSIGKVFENDPLENKEVQLWLGPLKGNIIDTELRYTEGWAHFPMAGTIFMKVED